LEDLEWQNDEQRDSTTEFKSQREAANRESAECLENR
jgi:hypothetical protein